MTKTKIELVLTHLIENRVINQKTAGMKYNCWRLSSIIFDLRRSGIEIDTLINRGDSCHYYLKSDRGASDLIRNYQSQRVEQNYRKIAMTQKEALLTDIRKPENTRKPL